MQKACVKVVSQWLVCSSGGEEVLPDLYMTVTIACFHDASVGASSLMIWLYRSNNTSTSVFPASLIISAMIPWASGDLPVFNPSLAPAVWKAVMFQVHNTWHAHCFEYLLSTTLCKMLWRCQWFLANCSAIDLCYPASGWLGVACLFSSPLESFWNLCIQRESDLFLLLALLGVHAWSLSWSAYWALFSQLWIHVCPVTAVIDSPVLCYLPIHSSCFGLSPPVHWQMLPALRFWLVCMSPPGLRQARCWQHDDLTKPSLYLLTSTTFHCTLVAFFFGCRCCAFPTSNLIITILWSEPMPTRFVEQASQVNVHVLQSTKK